MYFRMQARRGKKYWDLYQEIYESLLLNASGRSSHVRKQVPSIYCQACLSAGLLIFRILLLCNI